MDFTVLPPPLCPPRRAGGARTPPARALRASLNSACISRPAAAAPSTSTSSPAAARTLPARALRVSLNPACVSRPSAAAADAAPAKKPKRPGLSSGEDPTTNRLSGVGDEKENKKAPPAATAAASKVGTVLRSCSRVDEAPRLPLGNTTTRLRVTAVTDHAVGASAAKRKVTPADSEFSMLRPCSRGDEASRSPLGNATTRLRFGTTADGHAVGGNAAKRETTPVDFEVAMLRPWSRGEGASRLPLDNTARLRVGAAAENHAAPASAAKRKVAPHDSVPTKRRASPAAAVRAASASPSPRSSDSGVTVRELLETARTATDAIRRREIERLRAASRRELDRVVRTVEFNEPFISPQDVLR